MRTMSQPSTTPVPGAEQYPALDFANSLLTLPTGPLDLLGSPEEATAWLIGRDLAPAGSRLYLPCTARLHELRFSIRELLGARTAEEPAPDAALAAVNAALTATPSAPLLCWDAERGLYREQPHPADRIADHAMAQLAADAAELLTGPDADRLAACGGTPCTRFFVRTHASRHWCSTRCGDRVRAARAYAKRRAENRS
ncbi:CGNR zinc finger domain-containing protein [Kitasatospora griseola]|uniref:CGNR zinc finger domain-containing protein n=1 Tax=Kitasatospora griseola TaxID=2064 RepID=UPI0037F4EB50